MNHCGSMEKLERYIVLRNIFSILTIIFFIIFLIFLIATLTYEPSHSLGPAMAGIFYLFCSIFFLFVFTVSLFITNAIYKRISRMKGKEVMNLGEILLRRK